MLATVKQALGITSGAFDAEIYRNISAAQADLGLVDITEEAIDTDDVLIQNAVIAYCGYHHNLMHGSGDLAERYEKSYEKQKATFITSAAYTDFAEEETDG